MSATIEVTLEKLKRPLVRMGTIDVLVDGSTVLSLSLGESASAEVSAGNHVVQTILHGVFKRKSKELEVSIEENATAKIRGKYSRFWGNIKLQRS